MCGFPQAHPGTAKVKRLQIAKMNSGTLANYYALQMVLITHINYNGKNCIMMMVKIWLVVESWKENPAKMDQNWISRGRDSPLVICRYGSHDQ